MSRQADIWEGDLVWPKVQEVSEVQVALLLWVPGGQEQTGLWPTTLQTPPVMGHTVLEPGEGTVEKAGQADHFIRLGVVWIRTSQLGKN